MKFTFREQMLPYRTELFVAGARCFVSTNSEELLQIVGRPHPDASMEATPAAGKDCFEMKLYVEKDLDHAPPRAAHFRGLRHLVFASLPPNNFFTYDLRRRRVHAVVSPATSRDCDFWNTLALPITIGILGTTVGVVPLHCACLERDGEGLLVAGVSGAGKSTLSAALAESGFSLISDDWTYISKRDSMLAGHGLSARLKLLPDTIRFFPYLQRFAPRTTFNGELAYEFDPAEAAGFPVKHFSYPKHIFFLERAATEGCDFLPCGPEYVKGFFEKNAERLPDELSEAKNFRSSVLAALSAYSAWILRTGETPQQTAGALKKFLLETAHAHA
jgi:hypothetical protein